MSLNRRIIIVAIAVCLVLLVVFRINKIHAGVPYSQTATIQGVMWRRDLLSAGFRPSEVAPTTDLVIMIKEWLPGEDYRQLSALIPHVGHRFILKAQGYPSVYVSLDGANYDDVDKRIYALGAHVDQQDVKNLKIGVKYTLEPETQGDVPWTIRDNTVTY